MKTFLLFLAAVSLAKIALAGDSTSSLLSIPLKDIKGNDTSLNAYSGKVILVVNVASKCGYTPQYAGLEALYEKYKDKGFVIVGVPSNDFGSQEPGTADEIQAFCKQNYGVTFPLMEKVHVKGPEKVPLYVALTGKDSKFPGEVGWNFTKFLIDRNGNLVNRFPSPVKPDSAELTGAVESALGKS
jgi:glutathione peroxidase